MTAIHGARTRTIAASVCCVVAALSYSGAVRVTALLVFVLPTVVLVALATAAAARLSLRLAAATGLGTALAVAEIVNLASGTAYGPAARSTFAAAAFGALAVTAALSRAAALFTAAVAGVVVGALGLGAGAEVAPVAVATAVVTVVALAVVEAPARCWTRRAPQILTVVVFSLLVGALAAAIALQSDRRLEGEPAVLMPGAVQPSIRPPQSLGDPNPRPTPSVTPTASSSPGAQSSAPPPTDSNSPLRTIWLVVAAVVLALLLIVALRVIWVALAWRRLRRRLRRGSGPELVAGAWIWSTRRLRATGWPMPASLSADAVGWGQGTSGLPRTLRHPLRQIADATATAVYAPPDECDSNPAAAWAAADQVARGAVRALPASRRMTFAIRSVDSGPSRSAALAPATPEESRS